MSKEFEKPLTLKLNQSLALRRYIVSVYLLSAFSVIVASINPFYQIVLLISLVFLYIYQQRVSLPCSRLIWLQDNDWIAYDSNNIELALRLTPMSFLSSWLVVLAMKGNDGKRVNIIVLFDSVEKEAFRLLKLRLTILKAKHLLVLSEDEQ